jgi:hypothetical protein
MKPKRKADIQLQDLPDGSALLYDTESATAYPVNESAAAAWKLSDGTRTLDEIAEELEAQFDASRDAISADLTSLFGDLRSRGLLEPPSAE